MGQGLKLALAGIVIGAAAALALTRLMMSLLFGVSPADPLTFAGVAILLAGLIGSEGRLLGQSRE